MAIKLLDCTLRDGGHLNKSQFGEQTIVGILRGLTQSKVDFVEIGFVRYENVGKNFAAVNRIEEFAERFSLDDETTKYTVMIQEDQYDADKLPNSADSKIKRLRVSFHDYDMKEGMDFCRKVIRKGYICHVNPINIVGYSDSAVIEIIKQVNDMGAGVFTLVDTFGSMTRNDLLRLFMLTDHNLSAGIDIGFHPHDNIQMAFSHGQTLAELPQCSRDIIIDASLLGMGRPPGNLCLEIMMAYLNDCHNANYKVDYALDLIDEYIAALKQNHPWGYATAYALSAQYKLHRSYGEYLMKKQKLKTKQMRQILSSIAAEKKSRYDEAYIEKMYRDFILTDIDDFDLCTKLKDEMRSRDVLLLAPGRSLKSCRDEILTFVAERKPFVIAANFAPQFMEADYVFCSNIKRLENIESNKVNAHIIIGSNVAKFTHKSYPQLNANRLANFDGIFWDNCMLMLLNLVRVLKKSMCFTAGWDGFSKQNNFFDESYDTIYDYEAENQRVVNILKEYFKDMKICFITPSLYDVK